MALIRIPSLMRDLTTGQDCIHVPGATVGQVIDALEEMHPGIKDRLLKQGRLLPGIMVMVDGRRALRGLQEPVGGESEVRFLPVMAGG